MSTWIYRITVNQCLDRLAYRKRQKRTGILVSLFQKESAEHIAALHHFDHPGILSEQKDNARVLFAAIETQGGWGIAGGMGNRIRRGDGE